VTIFGIVNTNCNYLIIFLALVVAQTDTPSIQHNVVCKILMKKICKIEHAWSIIGIRPMALARRKQPGITGSCSVVSQSANNLIGSNITYIINTN